MWGPPSPLYNGHRRKGWREQQERKADPSTPSSAEINGVEPPLSRASSLPTKAQSYLCVQLFLTCKLTDNNKSSRTALV